MEIISSRPGSWAESDFIPVAVEIPLSQLNKIPDGKDLIIRLKKNSVITNEYVNENQETPNRKVSQIYNEADDEIVFRVKKSSVVHVPGEIGGRCSSRKGSTVHGEYGDDKTRKISRNSINQQQLSRKTSKNEQFHEDVPRIKKISRVEITGLDIERVKKISREGAADYHLKHLESGFHPGKELSTAFEEDEANLGINLPPSLRVRKHSVFHGSDSHIHEQAVSHPTSTSQKDIQQEEFKLEKVPEKVEFNRDEFESKQWPQVIAAVAANMGAFAFGTVMAWSATGLASMHDSPDDGELSNTTANEDSWIGSLSILGAVCACPLAGMGLEKIGRRKIMLCLTLPFILGWVTIGFAQNVYMIYSGRFLTGLCGGAFSMAAPAFTAETADIDIRGGLGSLFDLLLSAGMLYIYVIGAFVNWRIQSYACAVIPIIFHILILFVPESPRYLVEKEKTAKAEKAIYWLKGVKTSPELIQYELSELERSVGDLRGKTLTIRDTLRRPILKPTLLMIGIMFFTTMSGVDAVVAYTVSIFESAGAGMDPKLSSIIIGVVIVVGSLPTPFLVDRAGRRSLLLVSEILMCFSLASLGFYFHVKEHQIALFGWMNADQLSWLPLTSLIFLIVAYSLGCGPLCMVMTGELLPNSMKGLTSSIVLTARWVFAFLVTRFFGAVKDLVHDNWMYWGLAVICGVGAFFVYFCIPETMGKSVDEIQIYFVKADKDRKKVVGEDFTMNV